MRPAPSLLIGALSLSCGCHRYAGPAGPYAIQDPLSSFQQQPSWYNPEELKARSYGFSPQYSDRYALYNHAKSTEEIGVIEGGLLVCKLSTTRREPGLGKWGRPDLRMEIGLGNVLSSPSQWLGHTGYANRSTLYLSSPLFKLVPGDSVGYLVVDRNFVQSTPIAQGELLYSGQSQLHVEVDEETIHCQIILNADLKKPLKHAMKAVERDLKRLKKRDRVNPERSITNLAALVGWSDVRVVYFNQEYLRLGPTTP